MRARLTWHAAWLAAACMVAPLVAAQPSTSSAAPKAGVERARDGRDQRAAGTSAVEDDVGRGGQVARQRLKPGAYIGPRHRQAVHRWYAQQYGDGRRCPPGLVRRGGGCQPSAPVAAWEIGGILPKAAPVHPLPKGLLAQLPKTPPGHRYLLVGGDVLLVANRSKMVVDALEGRAALDR